MDAPPVIAITGASGLLGTALKDLCERRHLSLQVYAHGDLDITDEHAVDRALAKLAVSTGSATSRGSGLVINAAAYTDVDAAEHDEQRAFTVNATGAAIIATAAARYDFDLIHVSTDYVFDGAKGAPYLETDEPHPLNVYGRTKLAGEQAVAAAHPAALIVRTSWLYGPGSTDFPSKIAALARQALTETSSPRVEIVADQVGSPTAVADLAWGLLELYKRRARGLFHLAGRGSCSRYELAREVLAAAELRVEVVVAENVGSPTRAVRPRYSVLDCAKARALGVELPPWRESLRKYVREHLAEVDGRGG